MLSKAELTRLRKVRHYLRVYARGAGAQAARNLLDEWIAEEVEERERLKQNPPPRPKAAPKRAERMDARSPD